MNSNVRRVAITVAAVFATLFVAFALWQLRAIILLFVVSLAVASMIRAPIEFMTGRRVPRGLASAVVMLIGVIVIAGIVVGLGPTLVSSLPSVVQDVVDTYRRVRASIPSDSLIGQVATRLSPTSTALQRMFGGAIGTSNMSVDAALGLGISLFEASAQCIVVIVLALYWTSDRLSFERLWLSLLPPEQRIRARNVWRGIDDEVGAYLRSEAAQTLLTGVLVYAGFSLLGIRYPLLLAAVAALAWLVPIVGALIALPIIFIVAGLSGPGVALTAAVLVLLVYVAMELLVEPRLYRRRRFSTIWTVLTALALLDVLGVIGLFIAPIVANIAQISLEEWTKPAPLLTNVPTGAKPDFESLRARLTQARATLHELDQPPPHAVGLLSRLEALVEKTAQET